MKTRKFFRLIHREFGYFFAAMTIIYVISGVALNHRNDWNPDMVITQYKDTIDDNISLVNVKKAEANSILKTLNISDEYKSHYYPSENSLKIFLDISGGNGSVVINTETRICEVEKLERRYFFYPINQMHRNSFRKVWTWVADIFAVTLIVFAVTGIFMMKGKYQLSNYGIYRVIAGALIPLIFYFVYLF